MNGIELAEINQEDVRDVAFHGTAPIIDSDVYGFLFDSYIGTELHYTE